MAEEQGSRQGAVVTVMRSKILEDRKSIVETKIAVDKAAVVANKALRMHKSEEVHKGHDRIQKLRGSI